jgi:hypothetical protein
MQGGAAQGLGWALNEEYIYNADGVMENAGFLDYRMPVASDLPMIDTQIIEVPNPSHPYGVRGVGETPIVAPLAAAANAVHDAIGMRIHDLPLSPPRCWRPWTPPAAEITRAAMARVVFPSHLLAVTGGERELDVPARNVRELLEALEQRFPDAATRSGRARSPSTGRSVRMPFSSPCSPTARCSSCSASKGGDGPRVAVGWSSRG